MSEFAGSVWWLLVTLGILITFHEYGHFWVARRCGVKVLRFSVGFGKALWSRTGKDGTEYCIAAIPLGGYVKMLDEREHEGEGPLPDADRAFNRASVGARIAITIAGPVANILFTAVAFWLMFVIGQADYTPTLGATTKLAAAAGLREGDRIVRVDEHAVRGWSDGAMALVEAALEHTDVRVAVLHADGGEATSLLPLSTLDPNLAPDALFDAIGISAALRVPPAIVGSTTWRGAAAAAGLQAGDQILAVGETRINNFNELRDALQIEGAKGASVRLLVERQHEQLTLQATPKLEKDDAGKPVFRLGIAPMDGHDLVVRYGPLQAVPMALAETWKSAASTARLFAKMVTGHASTKNLGGPASIAQAANQSASLGVGEFLRFLAMLSMSLAILNLLPIPILDGGHLLYYLIELVKGSPISERAMTLGQYVGLALLAGLIGLANYNDLLRLVFS